MHCMNVTVTVKRAGRMLDHLVTRYDVCEALANTLVGDCSELMFPQVGTSRGSYRIEEARRSEFHAVGYHSDSFSKVPISRYRRQLLSRACCKCFTK